MKKIKSIKINKNLRFTLKKATVIFLIVLLLIEQNAYFFPSTLHAQENASDSANLEEMLDIRRANSTADTTVSPLASGSAKTKTDKNLLDDLVESPEVNRALREKAIVQSLAKKSFQYKERILFKVYYAYDSDVEVVVKDNSGEEIPVQISESRLEDDTLRLSLSAPWKMKPGKYNLEVTDGEKVISHQEFTWGVLALNTDKSIYMFNETANFSIAVLDEKGEMVCDAKVELLVKDPLGNAKTLSSEKGDIKTNDQCYSKELSLVPDYETQMQLGSMPGNYDIQLKAETKNGTYKVEDAFEVRELVDFDITRTSATRLFPSHYYPVELDIQVNADFKGRITEIIPENFEIIQSTSSAVLPYDKVEILSQEEMTSEKVLGGRALRLPFEDEQEVTLGFGQDILDPALTGRYKEYGVVAHDGTDFAVPIGTPVYPLDAGTVILADENGDYGTTMVIQHEWGRSYYGHLSGFKKQLGDSVYKDDVIALSGNSGLSTGAHLHLGVKLNKNDNENGFFGKVDPAPLLGMESDGQVLGEAIAPDVDLRVVTWEVDVKRGDSLKLGYQFKAPPESPQFYRLGPLRMYDTDNSLAFQESRQWQLAIDASNYMGRHIKTVEYALGNTNSSNISSATPLYSTDAGIGGTNGWTTTAPTLASDGFTIKIDGTNIKVRQAWIELRAQTTASASMADLSMGLSTCPGSQSTCSSAPVYRELPLFGTPSNISYVVTSGESVVFNVKGNAAAAFDGISDSDWATGVETLLRTAATGPSLNLHTAKLILTYESDFDPSTHDEVKTVRFPLDSTNGSDTGSRTTQLSSGGSQSFDYNVNIPDLASNSDIYDVYFEIYGQTGSTSGPIGVNVVSGSVTSYSIPTLGGATLTTQGNSFIFRPTIGSNNFEPNTAQQFNLTVSSAAMNAIGGEVVVTYKYSTGEASQTETVKYYANQLTTHGNSSKNTATIAPVISNTGASVTNIYAKVTAHNSAASNLQVFGDIDAGGATAEDSDTYVLQMASEMIMSHTMIFDMSQFAGDFVSGGNMTVSTDWSNTSGGAPSVEVYITYTWDGDEGGVQTKTAEYYMENSKLGGTSGTTAQTQRNTAINFLFPERVTKTLRSAYVANEITSSDLTTPVNLNQALNADSITSGGTGFIGYTNTGEAMSIFALEDITNSVSVSDTAMSYIFNYITDATSGFSPKAVVTYDVDYSETAASTSSRQIRTVEYSFGNSNTTAIASTTSVYARDTAIGSTDGWSTSAPTQASQGFTYKLFGSNIKIKDAWVELRAQTTAAASMADLDVALSTCPGTVGTCSSAPVYRALPLFGTPSNINYYVNSGESNIFYVKANALGALDGLTDSDWEAGVETLLRTSATGPSLINHTAKLVITYEYDVEIAAHNEVKTVRFPLDSDNTGDTGSRQATLAAGGGGQDFSYNADIPELASDSDILDVFFEMSAQVSAASNGTIRGQVVSGSPTNSPNFPTRASLVNNFDQYSIFRPTIGANNFQANTAQKLNILASTNAVNAPGGELVITYKYSSDEPTQTETVRYFVGQETASNTTKTTDTISPVISNANFSVDSIYVRAQTTIANLARTLTVFGDIDAGGAVSETSNQYAFAASGGEAIGQQRVIYDMSADAASFVSGGNLSVSTQWNAVGAGPVSTELFITFHWDASEGGTQTRSIQYYMENSKLGGTAAGTAQTQRNVAMDLSFPEDVSRTLRNAYVENAITSSDTTTLVYNMGVNEDAITTGGTGAITAVSTGEGRAFITLEDITSSVSVANNSQSLIFNYISDGTSGFSPKAIVTYDADFPSGTSPNAPTLNNVPFDNQKTSDTTPNFEFTGTDTDDDDLSYQIQIDNDYNFSSVVVDCTSGSSCATGSGSFTNTVNGGDTSPFTVEEKIRFVTSTPLSNATTYYWRVRATDEDGSGPYSVINSFTIDTSLSISSWFQTTDEQFSTSTLTDVEVSGSDSVKLSNSTEESGITVTNLTSDERTSVGNTPQSTASISPDADSLLLAWVTSTRSSGEPNLNEDEAEASISGLGLTWTFVGSTHYADRRIMHLFAAVTDESPSTGSLTITQTNIFNPQDVAWIIDQYEGVDTADPYGTLYYSTENSGTSESVTISDTPDTGDVTVAAIGEEDAQTVTREAGWDLIANLDASTNVRRLQTIYDADQDTSPSWSWSSTAGSAALGLVVNAPGSAPGLSVDSSDSVSAFANSNPTWTPSGGPLPEGKLVVAMLAWSNHPSSSGTMTLPSGWSSWPGFNVGNAWGSSGTLGACLCYKYTGASEPSSYTWTKSATINYWEVSVVVIDGADPTTPFTVGPTANTGADSTVEHLSVTTTTDNNLIVLFGANEVGSLSATPPTGYTEVEDSGVMWASHAVQSTAGAVGNQTTTLSSSAAWLSTMVAVNPYVGGSGGSVPVVEDQADSGTVQFGVTSASVTFSDIPSDGEVIFLFYVGTDDPVTVTPPTGFAANDFIDLDYGTNLYGWYKVASSESGATYTTTMSPSDGNTVLRGVVLSGVDTSDPIDVIGSGINDDTSIPGVTTTVDNTLLIMAAGSSDTYGGAAPGGWTQFTPDNNERNNVWYKSQSSAGSTGDFTWTSFFPNGAAILFAVAPAPAVSSSGTIMSSEIDYDWVAGATSWGNATFSTTETNGEIKVSLYYTSSTACDTVIPNAALSGNESGFDVSSSPINLSGLNTTTYNRICMKATLTDSGGTPFLNDWSVEWTASELETPELSQFMRHGAWFPLGTVEYETITARADGTGDNDGSGGTSITLNKPSGVEDGDFMFMVIAANIAGLTLTDNNDGAWEILHEVNETNVMHTWVLGRFADSEPSTWSFSIDAGTAWGITVSTYTNVDTVSPEDATSTYNYNITASNVSDCDSLTTVTDGAWNICVGTIDNGVSELSSGPAGYTQRVNTSTNTGRDIAVFDKEISSAGATGAQQINWSVANDDTGGFQFALRPASTSSGGIGIQPFTF